MDLASRLHTDTLQAANLAAKSALRLTASSPFKGLRPLLTGDIVLSLADLLAKKAIKKDAN
jgi:hypothetical protein